MDTLLLIIVSMISTFLIWSHRIEDISFYAVPMGYLSMFGIAFSTGAFMSMTRTHWMNIRPYLVFIALLFLIVLQGRIEIMVLGTASLAVLTIILGVSFQDKIINGRFDISYGVYIYAFPIQQMVINLVTHRFWLSMFIAALFTTIAAFLSYFLIEKPFLHGKIRNKKVQESYSEVSISSLAGV